jgi:catechol 2,3-dioxygenase-like lactoylglutathione lyase family enzyme
MRLNHLNLTVPDVAESQRFFETHFGLRCVFQRGTRLAVLMDDSGFAFTLSNFDGSTEVKYPGAFHIGFMQESRERVDEIHDLLEAAGVEIQPAREFHGAWTFYFRAPGGILVEVLHQQPGGAAA